MQSQAGWGSTAPASSLRRPLRHLLVVAGARGAGKTTFLKTLSAGQIGGAIRARLPAAAACWPQVEASDHADWMPIVVAAGNQVRNLVLHYDLINFRGRIGEPALEAFALARSVTIVNIKPDSMRLVTQFSARTSEAVRLARTGELLDEIWNHVAQPLLPTRHRPTVGAAEARRLERMRQFFLFRYGDAGWVEDTYHRWDAIVVRLTEGAALRVVDIEPVDRGLSGEFRWALR